MQSLAVRAGTRARIVAEIRRFFDEQDFLEVDTPVALSAPAPELHIEAPEVALVAGQDRLRRFLQTSPELPMKRLLAAGLERIYQIAVVFRDGELTDLHRPEFRLLEWYRRGETWEKLLEDCEGLVRRVAGPTLEVGGQSVELARDFRRVSVDEAFVEHAGFSILEAATAGGLRKQLDDLGISWATGDTWDDLYHRVFLSRVEPALLSDPRPLFLTHYPAALASLARLSDKDPRVAERFELYIGGLEIANGFGELTDPQEQRRRFESDRRARAAAGRRDYPLDETFLQALGGIGEACGIALGLDRLLMLLLGARTMDGVALIPWMEV